MLVAAIAAVILLARPSNIDLHGTFTMFQPLRCEHARPGDIFHTQMVFLGADGDVLGLVTVWRGARLTTESVRGFAETGVDYISVGALTHSAPALDVSLEVEEVG